MKMERTLILMIDDDRDDIYSTRRLLSEHKISNNFLSEIDPRKIISKLDSMNSFVENKLNIVILLDINMPNLDGKSILRLLKTNENYKHIPVVMLCTSDNPDDIEESYALGASGYLVKPIVPEEMLRALNTHGSHKIELTL